MIATFEKNSKVRFVRKPENEAFIQHFELAKEYIEIGKLYEIEHVFQGEPQQLELKGITPIIFLAEMFDPVD